MERNSLKSELRSLLSNNNYYIYGAGIVGKRLYGIIKGLSLDGQIEGFIISNRKKDDSLYIEEKKIHLIDELDDTNINILIAVSDAFQNEIIHLLETKKFKNIIKAYSYSLINEKNIPDYLPSDVPEIIEIDIRELLTMQFVNGEFMKYDILKELVCNKESDTYKIKHDETVVVDNKMSICSGNNQVIQCILKGKKSLLVKQQYEQTSIKYDKLWLEKYSDRREIFLVNDFLANAKMEWFQSLIGVIWPSAFKYADEIVLDIKQKTYVEKYIDILINNDELKKFIQDIYETDDVEQWQIEQKNQRMKLEKEKRIRIIWFHFESPEFRIKRFGHTISEAGIKLKLEVRNKYKEKIENYIHDIIIHTTDNYEQSERVEKKIKGYINA